VRVKICGVVTPADALAAVEAGADLIGFNFVPESKRFISLEEAEAIHEALSDVEVETVALFRNATQDEVAKVLNVLLFDWVQFHGEESPEDVARIEFPAIKALRGADPEEAARFSNAVLLLDHPVESGGGGQEAGYTRETLRRRCAVWEVFYPGQWMWRRVLSWMHVKPLLMRTPDPTERTPPR